MPILVAALALLTLSASTSVDDPPPTNPQERARRALEAATALDEQAQRATTLDEGRARWRDAARLLDECAGRDPATEAAPTLRFQAAVYLWAAQRAMLDQVDLLGPAAPERVAVARGLDEVVERLRAVPTPRGEPGDPFAQNVRFRLAQAIADRARLRPELDLSRFDAEKEAAGLLDRSLAAPGIKAFARLLHADVLNRLGQFGPAQVEAEEVAKYDPPPPPAAVAEVEVAALAGRGQFAAAVERVDRAPVLADRKALWKLRVAQARRRGVPPGERGEIDARMFGIAAPVREAGTPDARRCLMELARAVDEPRPDAPAEWWDLLADGFVLLREPERAARLAAEGADRAAAARSDRAPSYRFKAAGCWFQAEKYAEADAALGLVLRDPAAPAPLRARAGMLRALARGRALAARQPGATRGAYLDALEAQVRDFPADPASAEARWLLGKVRAAADRPDEAIALWGGIAHGQPRWLDAQDAAAGLAIAAVESLAGGHDPAATRPRLDAAREAIRRGLAAATDGAESIRLGLRLARLELIAGVGQPAAALEQCDRILRGPAGPDQHRQARLARLVALAELNRFAEAEALARNEARLDDLSGLLPALRLLDRAADRTEKDLVRRRTGTLIRILADRWADPGDSAPVGLRDEARLRQVRALIFSGDPAAARRAITRWGGIGSPGAGGTATATPAAGEADADADPLRDLGDTYFRLEAYPLAVEVERLRAGQLSPGSPAWFDARYGLALALFRSDRAREARKVIEATTILHPDLGGGETRARFDRLGQRIGAEAK